MTSEQALRRIRNKIFDYDNTENEDKAGRVLRYLKKRMLRNREVNNESIGIYSGLTRKELLKTGTCETDWF